MFLDGGLGEGRADRDLAAFDGLHPGMRRAVQEFVGQEAQRGRGHDLSEQVRFDSDGAESGQTGQSAEQAFDHFGAAVGFLGGQNALAGRDQLVAVLVLDPEGFVHRPSDAGPAPFRFVTQEGRGAFGPAARSGVEMGTLQGLVGVGGQLFVFLGGAGLLDDEGAALGEGTVFVIAMGKGLCLVLTF